MNKVLRCTMLSALFVTGLVASVLAAPYQPPTAVSTPAVDQAILAQLWRCCSRCRCTFYHQ